MRRIDRSYIERELSELTSPLQPDIENPIFKKENSELLSTKLKLLKILTDACDLTDAPLLMQFLEISDRETDLHLGHLVAYQGNQIAIKCYLDILKALQAKEINHRRIYALLKKGNTDRATFGRIMGTPREIPSSDDLENNLNIFYSFLLSLKENKEDSLTDEDILHLFSDVDNFYFDNLHCLALMTERFTIPYLQYLSSLIVETSPEAPINIQISEMMQAINSEGNHSGSYIIREHKHNNERVELYFQLLKKLHVTGTLSDSALFKILLIPNNWGFSLLSHLYHARPDNINNLKFILELLEILAKKTGPVSIQAFLGKQMVAEGIIGEKSSFAERLVTQHKEHPDLIIRMIRNNFFSVASLRDLAPLSEIIANELLRQAAATRDHAEAIALLQEALPVVAAAGAESAAAKPKALARYFELNQPKPVYFSLFSTAKTTSPTAQIKMAIEERTRFMEIDATATIPSRGISSLNS